MDLIKENPSDEAKFSFINNHGFATVNKLEQIIWKHTIGMGFFRFKIHMLLRVLELLRK
jgi:hypothetical protein